MRSQHDLRPPHSHGDGEDGIGIAPSAGHSRAADQRKPAKHTQYAKRGSQAIPSAVYSACSAVLCTAIVEIARSQRRNVAVSRLPIAPFPSIGICFGFPPRPNYRCRPIRLWPACDRASIPGTIGQECPRSNYPGWWFWGNLRCALLTRIDHYFPLAAPRIWADDWNHGERKSPLTRHRVASHSRILAALPGHDPHYDTTIPEESKLLGTVASRKDAILLLRRSWLQRRREAGPSSG